MNEEQITKEQWLEGRIMVDKYGRKPGLADLPLTMMTRQESFNKQKFDDTHIEELWQSWKSGEYYVSDGVTL